jgi:glycosyltransferase involved in cell wall biosynthesis
MGKILSIIVPSYNMEAYLPKCLGSLVLDDRELLQKLDVIVVNDGSKDRTSAIAHEYEAKYPGVFRVIDKPNGHYGSCINAALPMACGTFVKVLDADDSFDRHGLATFANGLLDQEVNHPDSVDAFFTDYVRVNEDDAVIKTYSMGLPTDRAFSLGELSGKFIADLWMQAVTYRLAIFKTLNYKQLEGIPFTDSQWIFHPMSRVRRARYIPAVVYRYLIGREGQTVDDVYYVKNLYATRMVTERLMEDYAALVAEGTPGGIVYLDERLLARIMLVYRYHLTRERKALLGEEEALVAFDNKVKALVPDLYERSGRVRYLRKIPLCFVSAWRKKRRGNFLPWGILTGLLMPLAMLRQRLFTRR